jgi:hypothetical protein
MSWELVVALTGGVGEGVVFMGVAFRELPVGALPVGDYLSRAIVDCRGAPTANVYMGLTPCR